MINIENATIIDMKWPKKKFQTIESYWNKLGPLTT